jgi:hypothetical protein
MSGLRSKWIETHEKFLVRPLQQNARLNQCDRIGINFDVWGKKILPK